MPSAIKIVAEVKALGLPHVLKLWLGASNAMLPVKYFTPTKPVFMSVEFHGDHKTVTKLRCIWSLSVFGIFTMQYNTINFIEHQNRAITTRMKKKYQKLKTIA